MAKQLAIELRGIDRGSATVLATLVACGAGACALASISALQRGWLGLAAALVLVVVVTVVGVAEVLRRHPANRRMALASPVLIAAVVWGFTFVLRPLELYAYPSASVHTFVLGFAVSDLTHTVAIAALGSAAWMAAFVIGLGRGPSKDPVNGAVRGRWSLSGRRAELLLVAGTVLWGALFIRQGGVSALLHSPTSIRKGQQSSFYGFLGI